MEKYNLSFSSVYRLKKEMEKKHKNREILES